MSNDEPEKSAPVRPRISEDWAATITGLVLLAAALVGLIPAGLVP
ncbi:hypothetical protein [Nocardiopsis ansamitocini]|uniref:Uncharacterized protein n=1 Tax=Nocardiopsis ansamitocini TaxID=1670832 RepID=A0A9W6UJC5_9ACTN|nr:hypothetical protein [Nocardiopsis ansamitocini]GLU48587.1 hypothetical protein Nans01_29380 [Nocardiopsis ansamitocini]